MARTKRWAWIEEGKGYASVRLTSWKYFTDFVYQEMLDYDAFVWRGQRRDDWPLESTLSRLIRTSRVRGVKHPAYITAHLDRFKYAARGRRGPNPPVLETENDWWALGQHFGLATPLLDWTESPFVAAFFAFSALPDDDQTSHRAVFALHRPTVERVARRKAKEQNLKNKERLANIESGKAKVNTLETLRLSINIEPDVEFVRPLSDENHRLVSQGGLFTRSPVSISLEDWVQQNQPDHEEGYTLVKILVPNKDRQNSLRILNRMNINYLSLFPDLDGASRFANLYAEIEKY